MQDANPLQKEDGPDPVKKSGLRRTPGVVIVAALQILGGVWGILMFAAVCPLSHLQTSATSVDVVVPLNHVFLFNLGLWALFEAFFAANVLAGILLLMRRRAGAWLTLILELLQVPWINFPAFSFTLFVGFALPVGFLFPKFLLQVGFKLGSGGQLWFRQLAEPASLKVNLVALVLTFVAAHWVRSAKKGATARSEPPDKPAERHSENSEDPVVDA